MKKIIKFFSLLLVSVSIMAVFSSKPADAIYDSSKNSVSISVSSTGEAGNKKLLVNISIKYQRGFDASVEGLGYKVCVKDENDINKNNPYDDCYPFISIGSKTSQKEANEADVNPQTESFAYTVSYAEGSSINISNSARENEYVVIAKVAFCSYRDENNFCQYYDDEVKTAKKYFKIGDLLNVTGNTDIQDEEIKSAVDKIMAIVYDTVMPIIYALLTVFLLIKGTILGVQIVKSADEPQVRQEKVGSLKWLVIGIAIAYAASGLVTVITGFFSGAFKF